MSFTFILLILLNIPPKEKDIEIVFQSLDFNKSEAERAKQYTEFNNTFILNDVKFLDCITNPFSSFMKKKGNN